MCPSWRGIRYAVRVVEESRRRSDQSQLIKVRLNQTKEELLAMRVDDTQTVATEAVDIAQSFDETKSAFDKVI